MFKRIEEKENILRIHSFDGQTIWLDKNTLIYEVGNFLGGGAAGTSHGLKGHAQGGGGRGLHAGGRYERLWAHLVCALWVPGTQLLGDERMEPIDGVLDIHPERFKLVSSDAWPCVRAST